MGNSILRMIAIAGFLASVICHLMSWLRIEPPWGKSVFVLHLGIFVLGFALIISAARTIPKLERNKFGDIKSLFAELPKWVLAAFKVSFLYVALNFIYFMYCAMHYSKDKVPLYLKLRGFSGHWMFFYGIEAIGFITLARWSRKQKEHESLR